jgi:hypothetical protein
VNEDNSDEDEGSEIPISMALTEWNMILLYEDRIRIVGLLSDKVVFEEMLELVCLFSQVLPLSIAYPLTRSSELMSDRYDYQRIYCDELTGCIPINRFSNLSSKMKIETYGRYIWLVRIGKKRCDMPR